MSVYIGVIAFQVIPCVQLLFRVNVSIFFITFPIVVLGVITIIIIVFTIIKAAVFRLLQRLKLSVEFGRVVYP